jgi:transposase
LQPIKDFAALVKRHWEGILAWTQLRISNGALEGMNNKIKLVSHRSFGFRNPENYMNAIYHCCANLPLP